ncbi:hypothetical protein FIBSPDRAFT_856741 [Athelia psychrophila]|uniref:Uncharacterized protein n=1 Tax=Athelia psychrophila TaxID=1759441 RepID=A0A166N1N0_9AGAM|nr:hypothetical protein FIBSPDRAFT_856741 [Fibularhizoctonia sp. CBS 109695]
MEFSSNYRSSQHGARAKEKIETKGDLGINQTGVAEGAAVGVPVWGRKERGMEQGCIRRSGFGEEKEGEKKGTAGGAPIW